MRSTPLNYINFSSSFCRAVGLVAGSGLVMICCSYYLQFYQSYQGEDRSDMIVIVLVLIFLHILGTGSKITKPMDQWVCDYCAMGKLSSVQ